MLMENKNLKDSQKDTFASPLNALETNTNITDISLSYNKINKLIMALYMVTDIMDKQEPLRNKLRTLGTDIISDINVLSLKYQTEASHTVSLIKVKINETMNFLDIATTVGMMSEMNKNILKKEFSQLYCSVVESSYSSEFSLSSFFDTATEQIIEDKEFEKNDVISVNKSKGQIFKGHTYIAPSKRQNGTRIGVQKAGTLMKAITDKMTSINSISNFDSLKKQRREDIIKAIRDSKKFFPQGLTIKDIKDTKYGVLASCGEKTLQRELVAMVKDTVLKKIGEKRWSRYFLSV